jgi:hypothetical protein
MTVTISVLESSSKRLFNEAQEFICLKSLKISRQIQLIDDNKEKKVTIHHKAQ